MDPAHTEWLVKEVFNKWVQKKHTAIIIGDLTFARHAEAERFLDRLKEPQSSLLDDVLQLDQRLNYQGDFQHP